MFVVVVVVVVAAASSAFVLFCFVAVEFHTYKTIAHFFACRLLRLRYINVLEPVNVHIVAANIALCRKR